MANNSEFVDELLEKSRSMERYDPLTEDEIKKALRMKKMGRKKEDIFDEIARAYFDFIDEEFEDMARGLVGSSRSRYGKTERLIREAVMVLEAEHPMTIRQLFYRLVSTQVLQNTRSDYQRLSRVMTNARNEGRADFDWIMDRSKPEYMPNVWEDPEAYFDTVAHAYHRDRWQDQPYHIEVWLEKDSLTGSVDGLCQSYGVTLRAHRGFSSTTKKYEIATLFQRINKPKIIFYVGDHDASGVDIERDLGAVLRRYGALDFRIERLAILPEDIRLFNLPPQRVKEKDSRSKRFRAKYGIETVEADALPPNELRARIETAICSLIDQEPWERAAKVEKAERVNYRDRGDV
jgi:hypothetical protein